MHSLFLATSIIQVEGQQSVHIDTCNVHFVFLYNEGEGTDSSSLPWSLEDLVCSLTEIQPASLASLCPGRVVLSCCFSLYSKKGSQAVRHKERETPVSHSWGQELTHVGPKICKSIPK